jgi:hypothetical protein
MLTCACGTRFEVDDSLAGQEVLCPECQQPLRAPPAERPPQVTSAWALASVLLALIGAFTLIGPIAAIGTGIIALIAISRSQKRLAGSGFAIVGIFLGILFTALTIVVLNVNDLFGLETWFRKRSMTAKVDTSGPMEIVEGGKGFALTRPNEKWGRVLGDRSDDEAVGTLQNNLDLLLMQLSLRAYVDVRTIKAGQFLTLDQCELELLAEMNTPRQPGNILDDDDDFDPPTLRSAKRINGRRLDVKDGTEGREMEVEMRCGGKSWTFLIRTYRRKQGDIYVVRAYSPKNRFQTIRDQLQTALDSFRVLR